MQRSKRVLGLAASAAVISAVVVACSSGGSRGTDAGAAAAAPTKQHGLTKQQAGEVLAKIGDRTITVGEFAERLAEQSPYLRARYSSPERRREFLDNMIRFELLAADARRRGLDKLPDVERTRRQVMIQQMMKAEFEDRIQLSDISEADVRAFYDANPAEFRKPEQVRASHIQMRDRATAQRVLSQLLAAPADIALFRRLATEHNEDDATRAAQGDLRFFSRVAERQSDEPVLPEALVDAAFGLQQVGDIARELVQTERGFHVVKLTGRRAALNRSLDDVRRSIQNRLWRERREERIQAFIDGLRRDAQIEENLAALAEVRVDATEGSGAADPVLGVPAPQPVEDRP